MASKNYGAEIYSRELITRNGERNVFEEINKLARRAREIKEVCPEMIESEALTQATFEMYPEVRQKKSIFNY